MTNRVVTYAAGASVLAAAAVISANTYAHRNEYRDVVGSVPSALRRQANAAPAAAPGAGAAGAVENAPPPAAGANAPLPPSVSAAADNSLDNARIAFLVGRLLEEKHFLHHKLDDTISRRLFDHYLDVLDPQHIYFTQADVAEWAPLRDELAARIAKSGDTSFGNTVFERFRQRFKEHTDYVQNQLKTGDFTFTGSDYYALDRRKAARPKDADEQRALWRQEVRAAYLQELLSASQPQNKPNPGAKPATPPPAAAASPQAIKDKLARRYTRVSHNITDLGPDDVFEIYVDQLCLSFDPHTDYFGKRTTADFNTQMRLSLFGIGAQLIQSDEGYAKIVMLTPGGPAIKSKKLKAGDQIVGVGQGTSGEMVEVQDLNLNKVVDMIRGPKGTTVRLSVLPAGATDPSTRKQVTLVRDEIKLEDQAAKAQIVDMPTSIFGKAGGVSLAAPKAAATMRVGVISLPSFYGGGDSPRSCSQDVATLITKLKAEKVAGIVLDLRGNPGGALDEAIDTAGLFVPAGPVVQVAKSDGSSEVDASRNESVAYDGPLVVLTSRQSASAAEIVAGALRDYGRAVVLGDGQTFGKGTVQSVIDLRLLLQSPDLQTSGDPGSMHLTVQKFYLPSGESTQLHGVPSDIVIPSASVVFSDLEKTKDNPLPFDRISAAKFRHENRVQPFLAELKRRSAMRVSASKLFADLKDDIARFEKQQADKRISLNEAQRLREKNEAAARDAARKKDLAAFNAAEPEKVYPITLADAAKPGLPPALKPQAPGVAKNGGAAGAGEDGDTLAAVAADDAASTNPNERDITLDEAERVLADYVTLSARK